MTTKITSNLSYFKFKKCKNMLTPWYWPSYSSLGELLKLRQITMFTSVFQDWYSPFSPRAFIKEPTLPHSGKLPAVTHVLFFQTACKMTSRQCIVAGPVSVNKTRLYYYKIIGCPNYSVFGPTKACRIHSLIHTVLKTENCKFYHRKKTRSFMLTL